MVEQEQVDTQGNETGPRSLRIEPGYFPSVTPEEQMMACMRTVSGVIVLNMIGTEDLENPDSYFRLSEAELTMFKVADVMYHAVLHHEQRKKHHGEAERMIASTVSLIDKVLIDEIASGASIEQSPRIRRRYYRGFGLPVSEYNHLVDEERDQVAGDVSQISFVTPHEQQALLAHFLARDEFQKVDESVDPAERQVDKIWVYPHLVTKEKMPEVSSLLDHDSPSLIPFALDISVAGFFIQNGIYGEGMVVELPTSELPRQEVYRALLRSGRDLFPIDDEEYRQEMDGIIMTPPKDDVMRAAGEASLVSVQNVARNEASERGGMQSAVEHSNDLRAAHWVANIGNDKWWPKKRLALKEEHYKEALGRSHILFGSPEIRLTRSGVSANETTIRMATATVKDNGEDSKKAYVMAGWYWETNAVLDASFEVTNDPGESNVIFVNVKPNYPLKIPPSEFFAFRGELVNDFKLRAAKNPNERFVLVIDKTTDLRYQAFDEGEVLPSNLQIIESLSLTKHQRGERNYFYGAILSWGDDGMQQSLDASLMLSRGTLTETGIVQLPLLARQEMRRRSGHYEQIGSVIGDVFAAHQENLSPEKRWSYENYGYFGYLVPPEQFLLDRLREEYPKVRYLKGLSRAAFMALQMFLRGYEISAYAIGDKYDDLIYYDDAFESGDSFGLDKFRMSYVHTTLGKFPDYAARFCPGTTTTPNQAEWMAEEISSWLASQMKEMK